MWLPVYKGTVLQLFLLTTRWMRDDVKLTNCYEGIGELSKGECHELSVLLFPYARQTYQQLDIWPIILNNAPLILSYACVA